MTPHAVHLAEVRYNPEIPGFQARATIYEADVAYIYPVHTPAALTAEFEFVATRLRQRARILHAKRADSLHMRRDAPAAQAQTQTHPHAA